MNNLIDKKSQKIIALIIICITVCLTLVFHQRQNRYDEQLNQANQELNLKEDKLQKAKSDAQNTLLNKIQADDGEQTKNANKVMLDQTIKNKAKKLANGLFEYNNSKEYLKRQNKVKSVLADSALSNQVLFPKGQTAMQAAGQDTKSELYNVTLKNTLANGNQVPVLMQVKYGIYYDGHLTQTVNEVYEMTYDKNSQKFTKIDSIGKIAEKKTED